MDGQRVGFAALRVIERLWRFLKYECVYLHAFETGSDLRHSLASHAAAHSDTSALRC